MTHLTSLKNIEVKFDSNWTNTKVTTGDILSKGFMAGVNRFVKSCATGHWLAGENAKQLAMQKLNSKITDFIKAGVQNIDLNDDQAVVALVRANLLDTDVTWLKEVMETKLTDIASRTASAATKQKIAAWPQKQGPSLEEKVKLALEKAEIFVAKEDRERAAAQNRIVSLVSNLNKDGLKPQQIEGLDRQLEIYFQHHSNDMEKDINSLLNAVPDRARLALATAIHNHLIVNNPELQKRIITIDQRGALEDKHVKAITDHPEYIKAGQKRNINNPPNFTHAAVSANESAIGSNAEFNPAKWADASQDGFPHTDIGNDVVDPNAQRFKWVNGRKVENKNSEMNNLDAGPKLSERDNGVNGDKNELDDSGRPINPVGETGMKGRGLLGKWGANKAADPIITSFDPATGRKQIVVIKRGDTGAYALPGGMRDPHELASLTAQREFIEEAGNIPMDNLNEFVGELLVFAQQHPKLGIEGNLKGIQAQLNNKEVQSAINIINAAQSNFLKFKKSLSADSEGHKLFEELDFNSFYDFMTAEEGSKLPKKLDEIVTKLAGKDSEENKVNRDNLLEILEEEKEIRPKEELKTAMTTMKPIMKSINEIFAGEFIKYVLGSASARKVFTGYVDDPRNTDNAWMSSEVYEFPIVGQTAKIFSLCKSGDDATDTLTIDPMSPPKGGLYASHEGFVALSLLKAPFIEDAKYIKPEQYGNLIAQTVEARDAFLKTNVQR